MKNSQHKLTKWGYEPKIIPKSIENYVSVQERCLRFLDSDRFLGTNLNKLGKSINSFPIMDENGLDDELFKKKLTYPHEVFDLSNFNEPLNLTKEDFLSTLKQTSPSDEEYNRTREFIKATLEYKINTLYSYSLPGYTWKAGLKLTKIKLDFIKRKKLLLLLENNIRGGISSVIGPRYIESDENTKNLYIDANNF